MLYSDYMQENMPRKPKEVPKDSIEMLEQYVAQTVKNFATKFNGNQRQQVYSMVDTEMNDLVVRKAPEGWFDYGRDGQSMQAIGQAVLLMRDNHGEIFTVWSNGAVTYEEVDHADVPAITLKLQPPPPQRLRAIAVALADIGREYF